MLDERRIVRVPSTAPPILTVGIDAEEEFDWSLPFDRARNDVSAIQELWRLQEVFDEYGVRPTYGCDYPIASSDDSVAVLKEYVDTDRCLIGAHLHTWVNPPFDEAVTTRNSYQSQLPAELERRKLTVLTETITANFGRRPIVHKAGRYGFGPHTTATLAALGFQVDLSASPGFDLSADGGPDYSQFGTDTYWFGPDHGILGLPTTGAFVGFLGGRADWLRNWGGDGWRGALLSQIGALRRQRLSPEGFTVAENRALTEMMLRHGMRALNFSLHSPSLKPGCTPYVSSVADRQDLIDHCRAYFDYFFGTLGGVTMTAAELRDYLAAEGVPADA